MKRMIAKFSILACGALALAACNAVQGLGDDIKSAGECGEDVINGEKC
ncbi:entericidin [Sphingomicrobium sp. XHP0235]